MRFCVNPLTNIGVALRAYATYLITVRYNRKTFHEGPCCLEIGKLIR